LGAESPGSATPVKEWLAAANIVEGPVFRQVGKGGRLLPGRLSPQNVALIVKAYPSGSAKDQRRSERG